MQYSACLQMDIVAHVGRRVKALRSEKGMSRRELGERSGLSERFLAEIEAGRGNPSIRSLAEIAAALETTPVGLLVAGPGVVALLGLRGAGKSTVGKALAIQPGRYSLRRLAARIGGKQGAPRESGGSLEAEADFAKEFQLDAAPLIAKAPGLEKYPKASSICILDETVSRIYRDGSQVDYVHQAFKLLDQHGVDHLLGELLASLLEVGGLEGHAALARSQGCQRRAQVGFARLQPLRGERRLDVAGPALAVLQGGGQLPQQGVAHLLGRRPRRAGGQARRSDKPQGREDASANFLNCQLGPPM